MTYDSWGGSWGTSWGTSWTVTKKSRTDGGGAPEERLHRPGPYYREDDAPKAKRKPSKAGRMNDAAFVALGMEEFMGK